MFLQCPDLSGALSNANRLQQIEFFSLLGALITRIGENKLHLAMQELGQLDEVMLIAGCGREAMDESCTRIDAYAPSC